MENILQTAAQLGGFAGFLAVLILVYFIQQQKELIAYFKGIESRHYADSKEFTLELVKIRQELEKVLVQNAVAMSGLCKAVEKLSDKIDIVFASKNRLDNQ